MGTSSLHEAPRLTNKGTTLVYNKKLLAISANQTTSTKKGKRKNTTKPTPQQTKHPTTRLLPPCCSGKNIYNISCTVYSRGHMHNIVSCPAFWIYDRMSKNRKARGENKIACSSEMGCYAAVNLPVLHVTHMTLSTTALEGSLAG